MALANTILRNPMEETRQTSDLPNPKNGDFAEAHVLSCKTITICLQQFHERILFLNHTTLVLPQMTAQLSHHLPIGSCQLGSQLSYRYRIKKVDNTTKTHIKYIICTDYMHVFVQPKNSTSPTWIFPKKKGDLYP